MDIYPAIDLYQGKAVRLYKGDYARMTVYSEDPRRWPGTLLPPAPDISIWWTWKGPSPASRKI